MSQQNLTMCDGCGASTPESSPHVGGGYFKTEVDGYSRKDERGTRITRSVDVCSVACLGNVLRALADELSPRATENPSKTVYRG